MFSTITHLFTPALRKSLRRTRSLAGVGPCPRLPQGVGGECGDAGCLPPKFTPATTKIVFLIKAHPLTQGTDGKCMIQKVSQG